MSCYHPIIAFSRTPPGSLKKELVFATDADKDKSFVDRNGHLYTERLLLPCGQCVGCRLEYARQWAMRCALEAKSHEHNYFVTLTYDDAHLPLREHYRVVAETGEVIEEDVVSPLVPEHLTQFLKVLREHFRKRYKHTGVRFFACGEYGEEKGRPHYHLILFNCPIPDLKYDSARDGYVYYTSEFIQECWSEFEGKNNLGTRGMCMVTDFSFNTASYVARYMLKKHKDRYGSWYTERGLQPPFTRASRRPGLGRTYLDNNQGTIYKWDSLVIPLGDGKTVQCCPPKYFDRIFDEEDPERLFELKERRKASASLSMNQRLSKTDLDTDDYLEVCEMNKLFSAAGLIRPL